MENRHVSYRLFSSYSKSCMNGQSHIAIFNNQRVGREKHWWWFSRLPLWKGPTIFRHPDISWFYIPIIYIMPLLYPMIAFFPHPTIMSSWYIPPPDEKNRDTCRNSTDFSLKRSQSSRSCNLGRKVGAIEIIVIVIIGHHQQQHRFDVFIYC